MLRPISSRVIAQFVKLRVHNCKILSDFWQWGRWFESNKRKFWYEQRQRRSKRRIEKWYIISNEKIASGGWSSDTKHVQKTLVVMSWQQYVIWHINTSYDTFNCVVKKMSHKCQLKAFEVNKGLWNLLSQMIPLLINIISNAHCFESVFTH